MKPELQRVAIPRGWRKLLAGEQINKGDRFWFAGSGPWKPAHHYNKFVPNLYNPHSPFGHVLHIRKTTARPRKVSKAGGRKGK